MIHLTSVILICSYCNAEIERHTEDEAREALMIHQKYVQCMKDSLVKVIIFPARAPVGTRGNRFIPTNSEF